MLSWYKKIPKSKESEEQKAECSSSLSSVINLFKNKISIKGNKESIYKPETEIKKESP